MIEFRQCLSGMVSIRIRHGWVLSHHIHAANFVGMDCIHDLDYRQPLLRVERSSPRIFKLCANVLCINRLVIGKYHRNQPRIRCSLHIVLSAQWMESGSGTTDLAGNCGQCDQAARIVCAVRVLGNPHSPKNDSALSGCIISCHDTERLRIDAANLGHLLRCKRSNVLFQIFKTFGKLTDIFLIIEIFFNDDIQ